VRSGLIRVVSGNFDFDQLSKLLEFEILKSITASNYQPLIVQLDLDLKE
jgi:hypothetical protein